MESKPVAEKIGITFDWNCAVSLRPLSRKLKRKIADAEDEKKLTFISRVWKEHQG